MTACLHQVHFVHKLINICRFLFQYHITSRMALIIGIVIGDQYLSIYCGTQGYRFHMMVTTAYWKQGYVDPVSGALYHANPSLDNNDKISIT